MPDMFLQIFKGKNKTIHKILWYYYVIDNPMSSNIVTLKTIPMSTIHSATILMLFALIVISCSKDDTTTADCSGSTPTYTADIAPILNASCALSGCHTAAFPSDGIDLSSYQKAKSASLNGKVLASMKHSSGAKAMPLGGAKLPDGDIRKVEC
jgi:hypothetical protein